MAAINLPYPSIGKTYTWANRPPASSVAEEVIFVSNVGISGSYWISDGSYWVPLGGEVMLAKSTTASSVTGVTDETQLAVYTLPGGIVTPWSQIEISFLFSYTNSASSKTMRIKNSAVGSGISGDTYYSCATTTTATLSGLCCIRSNNSLSSQKGWGIGSTGPTGLGAIASTLRSFTRGLSSDSDIVISGQLANSAEAITLVSYSIILRA
ncbi:MAG: hypothetical protein AB7I27_00310 [Bacteriovoracaceae bacterium]